MRNAIDSLLLHKPWMRYIDRDVLDVAARLRSIDEGYFILFNTMSGKYEVHNTENGIGSTHCFTVPYDRLDARTVHHCMETYKSNKDKIIKQIEEYNQKKENERRKDFENTIEAATYETHQELTLAIEKDELHPGYRRTHGGTL